MECIQKKTANPPSGWRQKQCVVARRVWDKGADLKKCNYGGVDDLWIHMDTSMTHASLSEVEFRVDGYFVIGFRNGIVPQLAQGGGPGSIYERTEMRIGGSALSSVDGFSRIVDMVSSEEVKRREADHRLYIIYTVSTNCLYPYLGGHLPSYVHIKVLQSIITRFTQLVGVPNF